jgi:hypothetical protein
MFCQLSILSIGDMCVYLRKKEFFGGRVVMLSIFILRNKKTNIRKKSYFCGLKKPLNNDRTRIE